MIDLTTKILIMITMITMITTIDDYHGERNKHYTNAGGIDFMMVTRQ